MLPERPPSTVAGPDGYAVGNYPWKGWQIDGLVRNEKTRPGVPEADVYREPPRGLGISTVIVAL
jgi:hypothetical protein